MKRSSGVIAFGFILWFCSSWAAQRPFPLEEATIAGIHAAMQRGDPTCHSLVRQYLDRIDAVWTRKK